MAKVPKVRVDECLQKVAAAPFLIDCLKNYK